uniref:POC1 centriolar protein homolog B-like n=1 Tax=Piliocolobus tephrosceles TaxID=591936 RepID=A0A8C9GGC0_9PRIM
MRNQSTLFISVFENIIYVMEMNNNNYYILSLLHNSYISDLCFPYNYNYVMYTCCYNSIMAWQFYDKKAIYLRNMDKKKFVYYDKKFLNIPIEKSKKICKLHELHNKNVNNSIEKKQNNNIDINKLEAKNKNLTCYSIDITKDGKYVALSVHSSIYLLTSRYMKTVASILNSHYDFCNILIFYNGYDLITAGNHGDIKIWKYQKNQYINIHAVNLHSEKVNKIILYNDKYICTSGDDGLITIYNHEEKAIVKRVLDLNNTRYKQIALNKKYDIMLCCGNNNIFMYYDLVKYNIVKHFYYSPFHTVHSVDIESNGNYFITGSDDGKIRLYLFKTCTCLYIGNAHNASINKCLFTFDNHFIISTSKDESIIYWRVPPETKEIKETE